MHVTTGASGRSARCGCECGKVLVGGSGLPCLDEGRSDVLMKRSGKGEDT